MAIEYAFGRRHPVRIPGVRVVIPTPCDATQPGSKREKVCANLRNRAGATPQNDRSRKLFFGRDPTVSRARAGTFDCSAHGIKKARGVYAAKKSAGITAFFFHRDPQGRDRGGARAAIAGTRSAHARITGRRPAQKKNGKSVDTSKKRD